MLRGIYSAAGAMSLSMQKMNLFAQNLSNSQTTGYKKKSYTVHSFEDMMVELPDVMGVNRYQEKMPVAKGSYIDQASVSQKQGELHQTGNPLNLAIMGEKVYFQLQTKPQVGADGKPIAGDTTYTISRDGHFMIDRDNYLITTMGDFVLDAQDRKIRLTNGVNNVNEVFQPPIPNRPVPSLDASRIRIDEFGRIFDTADKRKGANGDPVALAQIKLVEYTTNKNAPAAPTPTNGGPVPPPVDPSEMHKLLRKYGLAMADDREILKSLDPATDFKRDIDNNGIRRFNATLPQSLQANIRQGYLESSNVDITTEMINLMMTSKDYDMSQKLIAAEDKVLDKTINEMGRLQ